ncbi:hypothetical protein RhiJN_10642 [Ceratobasidium sp. AG-Ba]|nr:hypothetical protein RhiJN_10642 [Ceratobasidium sp. AG-Ba]QRW11383.1 hypothetical protein RhiLY_10382 [Ceratobasidium sp. AG-Ba]
MAQLSTEELLAMLAARGVSIPSQLATLAEPAPSIEAAAPAPTQQTIPARSVAPAQSTPTTKPTPVTQSAPAVKRARPVPRPPPSQQTEIVQHASSAQPLPIAQAAAATQRATSVPVVGTGPTAVPNRSEDRTGPAAPIQNRVTAQSTPTPRSSTPAQSVTARSTAPSRPVTSSRSVRLNAASGPLAGSRVNRPSAGSTTGDAPDANPQPSQRSIPVLRKLNKTESELLQRQLAQLRVGGRTIHVKFVGLKPTNLKGSHTKVSELIATLGLTDDDYAIVRRVTKYALEHTPGIDMSQTSKKQLVDDLMDAAVDQVLMALPEFEPYRNYGNWPLKLIATKVLRNTTNGFQNRHRPKKPKPEAQESENQDSERQESEHQETKNQEPDHQEPDHQEFDHQEPNHQECEPPRPEQTSPASNPPSRSFTQRGAAVPSTARNDPVAGLIKEVDDMSIDHSRVCDEAANLPPFSLPPELTASARDASSAMEIEPTSAPQASSASRTVPTSPKSSTVAEPIQVTINSTVTATATNRSVSRATSTVSAPAISTPSRAPPTPLRSEADAEMSPGVLAQIQGFRQALSASHRSRLAPSIQSIMSILDRLETKAIPIDPLAVLALSPTKNDGSRPPPYSEPTPDIDGNSDVDSELSDVPERLGGLITDHEDMELDNDVVADAGRKGKQPATKSKTANAMGGNRNTAKAKGKGVAPPAAASGSGSSSALQTQPARRSSRQVASTSVATVPPPNKPSRTRKK